jgi:hypothetical protein
LGLNFKFERSDKDETKLANKRRSGKRTRVK